MAPERGPLLGSTFDPPIYVPQLWGDIVWGSLSGRKMAPKSGTGLRRVEDRVRVMVSSNEYPAVYVVDRAGCVCLRPSESVSGWRWWWVLVMMVSSGDGRYSIDGGQR